MERWLNKVAVVVTEASDSIGGACARALLDKGMIVVGLQGQESQVENEFKASLPEPQRERFYPMRCDLCVENDIRSAFAWMDEHLGGVHVLITHAGIGQYKVEIVSENNTEILRRNININIMGIALCSREAFQVMKRRNIDGHIICINSVSTGHCVSAMPGLESNLYLASKYATTALTEVLRQEFRRHQTQIKITSLTPSVVQSKIMVDTRQSPMEAPVLQPSDVADAVMFCLQTPPNSQARELTIEPLGQQFR